MPLFNFNLYVGPKHGYVNREPPAQQPQPKPHLQSVTADPPGKDSAEVVQSDASMADETESQTPSVASELPGPDPVGKPQQAPQHHVPPGQQTPQHSVPPVQKAPQDGNPPAEQVAPNSAPLVQQASQPSKPPAQKASKETAYADEEEPQEDAAYNAEDDTVEENKDVSKDKKSGRYMMKGALKSKSTSLARSQGGAKSGRSQVSRRQKSRRPSASNDSDSSDSCPGTIVTERKGVFESPKPYISGWGFKRLSEVSSSGTRSEGKRGQVVRRTCSRSQMDLVKLSGKDKATLTWLEEIPSVAGDCLCPGYETGMCHECQATRDVQNISFRRDCTDCIKGCSYPNPDPNCCYCINDCRHQCPESGRNGQYQYGNPFTNAVAPYQDHVAYFDCSPSGAPINPHLRTPLMTLNEARAIIEREEENERMRKELERYRQWRKSSSDENVNNSASEKGKNKDEPTLTIEGAVNAAFQAKAEAKAAAKARAAQEAAQAQQVKSQLWAEFQRENAQAQQGFRDRIRQEAFAEWDDAEKKRKQAAEEAEAKRKAEEQLIEEKTAKALEKVKQELKEQNARYLRGTCGTVFVDIPYSSRR